MFMWGVLTSLSLCVPLFCQHVGYFIFGDAIIGFYFVYVDVVRGLVHFVYKCCYKQFVQMVELQEWTVYVRNMLLRLYVNMYASNWVVCIGSMAICMVLIYAHRTIWWSGGLYDVWVLFGLQTFDLAMLPSIRPSELLVGGMKYAIVYMSCRGWNLRGWIWSYLFSKGMWRQFQGVWLLKGQFSMCWRF